MLPTALNQLDECIKLLLLKLYCADRPKPPNPSYAQTVQNRPVNSQFVGLSFTAITSFFYINQPAQISLVGGFLDPHCEQNTQTLKPNCTYFVWENLINISGLAACAKMVRYYISLKMTNFRPKKVNEA